KQLETLVEGEHRDQMARIELTMQLERLTERALTELGLEADVLVDEYGPDQLIPVLVDPDGSAIDPEDDDLPEPVPFVRAKQEARLRAAQRNLDALGKVNPLALEEFEAMNERHQFLAEQLDDLKKTRKDLLDIIDQVDKRVQEVFAAAYDDVAKTFSEVFGRLFPGGEGRLVLTDPSDMLATGIEVEARPAGKKIRRLSLLSGGERSLVAVGFLISLFIARPSPFYILDEVEAALDDINLSRLLSIYEELRENSQLLVITHQKRTMEIADALYGVTMRGDGVSTVISQRLGER
ncbi:MAG: AAA family ATPase, partial [Propionicimonas sp.]|nr:AAA family ATPase [Propionicimonas sp.]